MLVAIRVSLLPARDIVRNIHVVRNKCCFWKKQLLHLYCMKMVAELQEFLQLRLTNCHSEVSAEIFFVDSFARVGPALFRKIKKEGFG